MVKEKINKIASKALLVVGLQINEVTLDLIDSLQEKIAKDGDISISQIDIIKEQVEKNIKKG